ncbi:MAG: Arm DNA-binding domain-containing protein [Bacteroidales bacterium]|nr:Arm DNA-binding domain-containing protein [Bacteroidales bacterium]
MQHLLGVNLFNEMRNNLSILFYMRKTSINSEEEKVVYQRVTLNGKRAHFSTGKSVLIEKWSTQTQGMRKTKPASVT